MIPDRIFLQIRDSNGDSVDEVTWCVDRINESDIEYVKASQVEQLREALMYLLGADLKTMVMEGCHCDSCAAWQHAIDALSATKPKAQAALVATEEKRNG